MGIRAAITRQLSRLAVRSPRPVLGVVTAALLALVAAVLDRRRPDDTTTTTTLPPLPPQVYAYVAMVGHGLEVGLGHTCCSGRSLARR